MSTDDNREVTFAGKPLRWATQSWIEGYGIRIVKRRSGYWAATHNASGMRETTQWDDPQRASDALELRLREACDALIKVLSEETD